MISSAATGLLTGLLRKLSVDGDPVDLSTGSVWLNNTDLFLTGRAGPLALARTYRPKTQPRGRLASVQPILTKCFCGRLTNYTQADLILPDGGAFTMSAFSSGSATPMQNMSIRPTPTPFMNRG